MHTVNARETVKQWVNVHGLPKEPTFSEQMTGCNHQVWCNERGKGKSSAMELRACSMAPHWNLANDGAKCGTAGRYFLDVGISSSWLIAKFWGLVDVCAIALNPPGALFPQQQSRSAGKPRRSCDASNIFQSRADENPNSCLSFG